MINTTQLENQILESLISLLYAEAGFSDVDAKDIANDIKVDIKSVRGALGSLVKKGIVVIESTDTYGVKEQFEIIYLHSDHYYLHPEWKNEKTWLPEEMVVDLTHNKNKTIMKNTETQLVKRGRPVSTNSARQARLAAWETKRASGMEVKRGRPAKAKTNDGEAAKAPKVAKTNDGEAAKAPKVAKVPKAEAPKYNRVLPSKTVGGGDHYIAPELQAE